MEMLEEDERQKREDLMERRADLIQLAEGMGKAISPNPSGYTEEQVRRDIQKLESRSPSWVAGTT